MFGANLTTFHPTVFVLTGIPGLEHYHTWLSIPFCLMCITAVLANGALILVVFNERTLHEPMYVFLSMLAGTDILLSTATVPKALTTFWFPAGEIAFDACITQTFFIHVAFVAESGILLAMAFDHSGHLYSLEIHLYLNSHGNWKNDPGNLGMEHWDHFPYHIPAEEAAMLSGQYHPTLIL